MRDTCVQGMRRTGIAVLPPLARPALKRKAVFFCPLPCSRFRSCLRAGMRLVVSFPAPRPGGTRMTFVSDLEPRPLWRHFDGLLAIPRPSKQEERARRYVIALAAERGLRWREDATGNLVVE